MAAATVVFVLNPQSGIPIYRQLVDQIKRLVAAGQLAPGTALPSVRDLALEHSVNPMTISKAYSLLEAEGWLERRRGKPMTVAAGRHNDLPLRERLRHLEKGASELVLAARQLDIGKNDLLALLDNKWERSDE